MIKQTSSSSSARLTAVKVICAVTQQGRSLTDALSLSDELDPQERAFCRELCYGTIRWYIRLEAILSQLLKKNFKPKDDDIKALALLGLYQIIYLNTPDHAAVSETVKICLKIRKGWAKGLLNALLRNFLRQRDALENKADSSANQRYAHPEWLVQQLDEDWGQRSSDILTENNQHPPMSLRVNSRVTTRDLYTRALEDAEISATSCRHNTVGLSLEQAVNVDRLPDFWQGACSVQDYAAQLAAPLLDVKNNQRVLDVCAAPGGKTAHILENSDNKVTLTAIDIDPKRNHRVLENLKRLKLTANVLSADGLSPNSWFDGQLYQRILLDAPCSATGVIRRHPDIKLLRKESDIPNLVALQQGLLQSIWPLLEKNGILLYATCSTLAVENSHQIAHFLSQQADAEEIIIEASWGQVCQHGRQILPGEDNMDGFYYACITKI